MVGLKRTGKSCRLRWVNYLHPGLKRGKMTPQEERLVLELHSKWGNRFEIFIVFIYIYTHISVLLQFEFLYLKLIWVTYKINATLV